MSDHWYDIRTSESCVDPNPLMVERQDPDDFTRFQTRERCALEIAAYVFNTCRVPREMFEHSGDLSALCSNSFLGTRQMSMHENTCVIPILTACDSQITFEP